MALRLASKIRCSILPKFTRSFTAKAETATCVLEQQKQNQQKPESALGESPVNSPKFNVYIKRNATENETAVRQQIDNRELQPSKLPEYYKSEIDIQQGIYPLSETSVHSQSATSMQPRRFEVSKTYANVTLPLKTSKLASPFPSAVKSMTSHTISDQEKADQMLAEARLPKGTVLEPIPKGTSEPINVKATPNRVYKRNYSKRGKTVDRNDEKCKKVGKKKTKCVKMKAPGCKKVKAITCDKKRKPIQCKKVNAPYPSYSEACYEDVLEKPSECKLCPWRPKDNPHFKGTKKKYHTKINNEENVAAKAQEDAADGYLLDAKKKPCKNPSEKKKDTKKEKTDKKSKKKSDKGKSKSKKKKKGGSKGKKASNWTSAVRRYGEAKEENETEIVINSKMILAKKGKKKDKKKKRPCNKFPFDKCKKKKDKGKGKKSGSKDKCKKKKKPFIKGCLNNDESSWQTIEITSQTGQPLQLALAKHGKKKTKKPKKSDKKRKPKTRDECEKKTPTSRECPADLIDGPKRIRRKKKKSNKKKWTSARVKPYMAKRKRKVYRAKEKNVEPVGSGF